MSIFNAIGGALGGIATIVGQHQANKANKAMAEYQNQQNLKQWERQNQYNSPTQQMQRLKEAGINPNMAYAKGTINNTVSSSPRMERAEAKSLTQNMPQLGNFMSLAQIQQMKQQTEGIRLDNIKKAIDVGEKIPKPTITTTNVDGKLITEKEYKNPYYVNILKDLRAKQTANETAQLEQDVSQLKSRLAKQGFTVNDPKLLRILTVALENEDIDIGKVGANLIKSFINKLGLKTN